MRAHYTQPEKKQGFNFRKIRLKINMKTKASFCRKPLIPQNILCSNKRYYESCKPNRDCTAAQTVQNMGTRPSRMGCRTGFEYESKQMRKTGNSEKEIHTEKTPRSLGKIKRKLLVPQKLRKLLERAGTGLTFLT